MHLLMYLIWFWTAAIPVRSQAEAKKECKHTLPRTSCVVGACKFACRIKHGGGAGACCAPDPANGGNHIHSLPTPAPLEIK